jgi:formylglycine-generating enzyme required for sulfatase activity
MAEKKPLEMETGAGAGEDKVSLKPFLGIRPGVYLSGLYGFIILFILFVIFLLPGLVNPGMLLAVSTEPFGAAVRIDGVYMDTAPCELFVSRGKHKVEIVLPGFRPWQDEIDVQGQIAGSRLFPLKLLLRAELSPSGPAATAFSAEAADFAAWTLAGEPTAAWQIPLSLSEGAYRFGPAASDPAVRSAMEDTLEESLGFGTTRAALRDILRAKFLLDNRGLSPSPLTFLRSAKDMLTILDKTEGSAFWLAGVLQGEAAAAVAGSAWYTGQSEAAALSGGEGRLAAVSAPGRTVTAGGLEFLEIPGGRFTGGGIFPKALDVEGFYIAETEITNRAWDRFLEERPEWRGENAAALAEKGLAGSGYLMPADLPGAPESAGPGGLPSGISWYAAAAFCEWFSSALPPEWAGWEARLPTETEWEYAAYRGAGMSGVYWEWCGNPYIPLDIFRKSAESSGFSVPERPVKGGAWVNPSGSVTAETRASLPPDSCSPFVSFRPVLSPGKTPSGG